MDSFRSGVVRPSLPHPSLDAWAELVETWTIRYDFTPIQQFKILAAASRLGSLQATNTLEGLVRDLVDPDDNRLDQEDENGHHIRAAMYELQRKRRRLPLAVAERFARASRSNLAYAGVEAIAVHADRAALELLLRLYNGSSDPIFRGSLSHTTETLAGRLGLIIAQVPEGLKVA
jgi:hypothetical protein